MGWGPARLVDGEPVVQATDALGLGESALGVKVGGGQRTTAAQAGGLAAPGGVAQEAPVRPHVARLPLGALRVAEHRRLAPRLAATQNGRRGSRLAPATQ